MTSPTSDSKGIWYAVAGFTFWVLTDTTVKIVGRSALPAYEVIAFLGLFIAICLCLYAAARREFSVLRPRKLRYQAVRSCLDLINNLCVVVALRHVPLTLFYILVFTAPMVITLLSAVFLREHIGLRKAAAIVFGFLGVVIAVNPFHGHPAGDWVGYAACATCVTFFSINMVWSRVLTRTETPESLTLFSGIVGAVAGFSAMLVHAEPLTAPLLLGLCAMGLFCSAGTLCFFLALKHTTASTVSQYHYTQLVTGACVSWLVWRELPTPWMLSGASLIVAAGAWIAILASRR